MSVEAFDLTHDLVIFGGLDGNDTAQWFFDAVRELFPTHASEMLFDDRRTLDVAIPGLERRQYDLKVTETGKPQQDLALIIVWRNPNAPDWRRGILCVGFTSYGTRDAAAWFFNEVIPSTRISALMAGLFGLRQLRFIRSRLDSSPERRELHDLRRIIRHKNACTLAVVEMRYRPGIVQKRLLGYRNLEDVAEQFSSS